MKDLKRKAQQDLTFFAFRLTELYENEFPPGWTKIQMNLDDSNHINSDLTYHISS